MFSLSRLATELGVGPATKRYLKPQEAGFLKVKDDPEWSKQERP